MAIACTIYKILYNLNSKNSEYSSSEMARTILISKIYKIEILYIYNFIYFIFT